jgi:Uma2 family endonuclease
MSGVLVLEPWMQRKLIRQRRKSGADRWDEVWDGVYVIPPLADVEHQYLGTTLAAVFLSVLGFSGLDKVYAGVNVSDRDKNWKRNYRCPDVAVILRGGRAIIRGPKAVGGPALAVEVVSPRDRTRERIPFYAKIGTRELLVIDRKPWALELYRLEGDQMRLVGRSTLEQPETLASTVVPLTFRLVPGDPQPRIEVRRSDGTQDWLI